MSEKRIIMNVSLINFKNSKMRGTIVSKNGSEREFIFTLYQKENISVLEKELNLKLAGIILEEKYDISAEEDKESKEVLKLDMYGIELKSNVEVFVENVLSKSDASHQERLLKLIKKIEKGIIVYQAMEFRNDDVQQLRGAVTGKDINLHFVKINPNMLKQIYLINSKIHKLKIYEKLNVLHEISKPIQLLREISIIKPIKGDKMLNEKVDWDFSKRGDVNNYLLEQLRLHIPYYLPFQRRKSNIDTLRLLQFGGGKSGISLVLSINSRNRALVELRFSENSPVIYHAIKEKEQIARDRIGKELMFIDDKHTIAFHFKPYPDVRKTIDNLVLIAERFIQAFSNYTYYYDKQEMWEQHENGL